MSQIREGDKRFKCDIITCDSNFKTKYSLKRHMKIHKINKEWVCNKCGKQFALQQYLVEHDFTHTRQKPFQCNIDRCTETFRQRGKRSIHQSLAHGIGFKRRQPDELGQPENQIRQDQDRIDLLWSSVDLDNNQQSNNNNQNQFSNNITTSKDNQQMTIREQNQNQNDILFSPTFGDNLRNNEQVKQRPQQHIFEIPERVSMISDQERQHLLQQKLTNAFSCINEQQNQINSRVMERSKLIETEQMHCLESNIVSLQSPSHEMNQIPLFGVGRHNNLMSIQPNQIKSIDSMNMPTNIQKDNQQFEQPNQEQEDGDVISLYEFQDWLKVKAEAKIKFQKKGINEDKCQEFLNTLLDGTQSISQDQIIAKMKQLQNGQSFHSHDQSLFHNQSNQNQRELTISNTGLNQGVSYEDKTIIYNSVSHKNEESVISAVLTVSEPDHNV